MKKIILSFILAISCIAIFSVSAHADYSDVSGHWAEEAIIRWSDYGVLEGYDGKFSPNDSVTRAQLSKILVSILDIPTVSGVPFADVQPAHWFYEDISTMYAYGIITPIGNYLYPNSALTREEAVHMIAMAFGKINLTGLDFTAFTDRADIDETYLMRIEGMLQHGLISGYPDGSFKPQNLISRAEIVTILNNMIDLYITEPGEYEIKVGQNVLVAAEGVTLSYNRTAMDTYARAVLFLTASASRGINVSTIEQSCPVAIFAITEDGSIHINRMDNMSGSISLSSKLILEVVATHPTPSGILGSATNPYLVSNAEEFEMLRYNRRGYYELIADIVLPDNFVPIGTIDDGRDDAFYGKLNGNGHTITYNIKSDNYTGQNIGIFAEIAPTSTISNLHISGTIDITFADGAEHQYAITDSHSVGALAAISWGIISGCSSDMTINVKSNNFGASTVCVGGLVGALRERKITESHSSANISVDLSAAPDCKARVGGIAGALSGTAAVSYSSSDAKLSTVGGYQTMTGGIAGHSSTSISSSPTVTNCYALGSVSGSGASFQVDVGAIIGQITYGTVEKCWSYTELSATGSTFLLNIGAIAGSNYYGKITNCWANPSLILSKNVHAGGIVGRLASSAAVSNCFTVSNPFAGTLNTIAYDSWNDGTVSGCTDFTNMNNSQRAAFISECAWDFGDVWSTSPDGYPYLKDLDMAMQLEFMKK